MGAAVIGRLRTEDDHAVGQSLLADGELLGRRGSGAVVAVRGKGRLDPIITGILGGRAVRCGTTICIGGLGGAVGIGIVGIGHRACTAGLAHGGISHSISIIGLAGVAGDGDGAGSGFDVKGIAAGSKAVIAVGQRRDKDLACADIGVVLVLCDLVIQTKHKLITVIVRFDRRSRLNGRAGIVHLDGDHNRITGAESDLCRRHGDINVFHRFVICRIGGHELGLVGMGIILHIADLLRIIHPIPPAVGIAGGVGQRNGAERRPEGGGYACGSRADGGRLSIGRREGLGEKQLRVAVACHSIITCGHGFREVVAAGCRQFDFDGVSGAGGKVAGNRGFTVKPLDISSQTGRGHGHAGVRCIALNRSIQVSDGHAGDGRLGDNNRNCFWQGCCITCCNICYIVRC